MIGLPAYHAVPNNDHRSAYGRDPQLFVLAMTTRS
jgi:hypothetical protein